MLLFFFKRTSKLNKKIKMYRVLNNEEIYVKPFKEFMYRNGFSTENFHWNLTIIFTKLSAICIQKFIIKFFTGCENVDNIGYWICYLLVSITII
jgi:hypothetical protein